MARIRAPKTLNLTEIRKGFQSISNEFGPTSKPVFTGLTLLGLTATRLTQTDSDKKLSYVSNLASWIAGTTNRVTVTDDTDGTVTLNLPQDIHTGASPEFVNQTLTGYSSIAKGILAVGTETGFTIPSGAGIRLMWIPAKAAFRTGFVTTDQWDTANIGNTSFATGYDPIASGVGSVAIGYSPIASNTGSVAMGTSTISSGVGSFAAGGSTVASGDSSTAFGSGSTASGDDSTVSGVGSVASGRGSFALGFYTVASGCSSFAFGYNANVQSFEFIAGDGTPDNGYGQIAIGYASLNHTLKAENTGSIAMGQDVNALTNPNILVFGRHFSTDVQDSFNVGFGQLDYQFTATAANFYDSVLTAPNFISNVAIGTSPYACTSTTLNTNLNADLLDGQHASEFQASGSYQPLDADLSAIATLNFASISFLKKTAADTWALDTNTYYKSGDSPSFAAITGTSFIIGANTLNGTEFGYLDGQNQALKTTDDVTFDIGTFTEVNIGQVGSNAATKLAVGLSATSTFATPAYIEMITTPAFPAVSAMSGGIHSEISHLMTAIPSVSAAGYFYNTSSGDVNSASGKSIVGLYGGAITALTNTASTGSAKIVNIYGLYFSCYNAANWQPTATASTANKIITTEGLFVTSYLGYSGYTISGTKAQAINYGANISGIMAGTYGATSLVPAAGLNYGAYITTTDSLTNALANITSYGLYISACASSTKSGGGIITSYGIYETGGTGSTNILGNNTRIGGLTAPTVACDVTGAILASTTVESTTGFKCGGTAACADNTYALPTSITTKGGIITAIS